MNIKVSIVVPVYNSEIFLPRCIDSLVKQTLKEIEIILINDCSTDDSLSILEEYKQKYPEIIKLIDLKENKGPGGARNEGLRIAKGEYIGFVDSDDYASEEMFKSLYSQSNNYDIVDCNFFNGDLNINMGTTTENVTDELNLEKKKELFIHSGYIWSKIIKRALILDNHIQFRENKAYEDIDFLRIVIYYCNKINFVNKVLYFHRNNMKSVTSRTSLDIQVFQKIDSIKALVASYKKLGAYKDYKDEITYLIYKTYAIVIEYAVYFENYEIDNNVLYLIHDFFLSFSDNDYTKNKYILKMNPEDVAMIEEFNSHF